MALGIVVDSEVDKSINGCLVKSAHYIIWLYFYIIF